MDKIKQVIVVRKDLNMRKGKIASQVAHGAMLFMLRRLQSDELDFSDTQLSWMFGVFTKVVLGAESEQELLDIHTKAKTAGLESHLMLDNGDTEFHGQKTLTCIAIGPDFSSKIDPITKDLKLI